MLLLCNIVNISPLFLPPFLSRREHTNPLFFIPQPLQGDGFCTLSSWGKNLHWVRHNTEKYMQPKSISLNIKFSVSFSRAQISFLVFDKVRTSNSYFGISKKVSPIAILSTRDLQYEDTTQMKMLHQVRHAGACDVRVHSCLKQKPP